MATGVQSWSKTAATNATADSNVNWAEGMAPSAVNDSSRGEMSSVAKWRDDIGGTLTTGGTSTAYTLTTNQGSPGSDALMSGMMYCFIPHATSGLNPTLRVDGLTARAINQSTGVAVPTGALLVGTPYVVTYIHATTEFIVRGVLAVATVNDPLQVLSVDPGATVGPTVDLYRNSASPANSDFLGSVDFNGKDNGAAKQLYAQIITQITDVTAASEDAIIILRTVVAGTLTDMLKSSATGITIPGTLGVTGQLTASFAAPTVQKFTSGTAATYTPTPGMVRIRVTMCGPGGGGGARAVNGGNPGGNGVGVATLFADWSVSYGAGGGTAGAAAGLGGSTGSDGTGLLVIRVQGGDGNPGLASTAAGVVPPGANGGSNPFGGAGRGGVGATGSNARPNTGAGGGGGSGVSTSSSGSGGGSGEYAVFWMTAAQVGVSKTYTVPVGGTGGAAGGLAGGDGAAGVIIVEEFYS